MGLNIKINLNPQQAIESVIDDKLQLYANSRLWFFCNEYVPMITGMLASTVSITPEYVHYKVPYATTQYYTRNLNHFLDKHPLATDHWDDAMVVGKGDRFAKDIENAIRAGGNYQEMVISQVQVEIKRMQAEAERRMKENQEAD